MDLKPISTSPFVYTTRLEEMPIFRKDLNKISSKKVIKEILSESKPCYSRNTILKGPGSINKCGRTKKKNQNKNLYIYQHRKHELKSQLSFDELQSKVKEIRNKINGEDEVTSKGEIETTSGSSKNLLKVLAICKPLKVILQDCNLIVHKKNNLGTNGDKMDVLNYSSKPNDDVVIKQENKTSEMSSNKNKLLSRNIKRPAVSFVIKTVNDFKTILCIQSLKDCAIVIYNVYLKKIDAYHINKNFKVTECRIWNYVEVTEIPMKVCQTVYNIIACCWRSRESYISVLMDCKQYKNIYKVINTLEHLCSPYCTCCCTVKTTSKANVNIANEEESNCTTRKKTKLIDIALGYRHRYRYKETPEWKKNTPVTCDNDKMDNKYYRCMTLLQLDDTNGNVEFYEMDRDHIVYSKLIINNDQKFTWTALTVGQTRTRSTFTCTDPANREEQIINYCNERYVPFNIECFFRRPMEALCLSAKVKNKNMLHEILNLLFIDNIKHTTSLVGAGTVLSLLQEKTVPFATRYIQKKTNSKPAVKSQPVLLTELNTQSQSKFSKIKSVPSLKRKSLKSPIPATEETYSSKAVNSMIKDILHRFRNVLLTINADGKVAAALNAPLNSLNSSELNILQQILNHAQLQVDRLGLTPGTYLNADGLTVTQSNLSNADVSTTEANNFNKNTEMTVSADITQIKNEETKNAYLQCFTKMICNKKMYYEKSFYSFINDTVESTPKITNVFSLIKTECTSSDNSDVLRKISDTICNVEDTVSVKEETITDPNFLMDMCINECKEDLKFLDNEIEVTPARKRKSLLNSKTELPKTRVKRNEEVVGDGMGRNDLKRPNILARSKPSTSTLETVPSIGHNFRLRNLLLSEPKKMHHLPVIPLVVPQNTTATTLYEVSAYGKITAHTNIPKV